MLKRLKKIGIVAAFTAIIVLLILWPYYEPLFVKFEIRVVIGFITSALLAAFLYFDERIQSIMDGGTLGIRFTSLTEAFNLISSKRIASKKIRIYAISSYKILSLFSSSNMICEECSVLLRTFPEGYVADEKDKLFKKEINEMIDEWNLMLRKKRVKKLNVCLYSFLPTEYHVIFDDKYLISGLYTPNRENNSKVDVEDPILITDDTNEGKQIIKKYIVRFDAFARDLK